MPRIEEWGVGSEDFSKKGMKWDNPLTWILSLFEAPARSERCYQNSARGDKVVLLLENGYNKLGVQPITFWK